VNLRFVLNGVDHVGGAERNVEVRHVVLVEKSGFVGWDAYAEDTDVIVFKDKMMVGLLGDGDGDWCLDVL
jgi:hypothetical protein